MIISILSRKWNELSLKILGRSYPRFTSYYVFVKMIFWSCFIFVVMTIKSWLFKICYLWIIIFDWIPERLSSSSNSFDTDDNDFFLTLSKTIYANWGFTLTIIKTICFIIVIYRRIFRGVFSLFFATTRKLWTTIWKLCLLGIILLVTKSVLEMLLYSCFARNG